MKMINLKAWFMANKVLLISAGTAVAGVLTNYAALDHINIQFLVLAVVGALAGWAGKNLRGQWPSIAAIVTNLVVAGNQAGTGHQISWLQVVIQSFIIYMGLQIPAAKDINYERSAVITEAKIEAKETSDVQNKTVMAGGVKTGPQS